MTAGVIEEVLNLEELFQKDLDCCFMMHSAAASWQGVSPCGVVDFYCQVHYDAVRTSVGIVCRKCPPNGGRLATHQWSEMEWTAL